MSDESTVILPLGKLPAEKTEPGVLVIFSKPKVGKTSLVANLPDCLLMDFEKGSGYVEAMKVKIDSVETLKKYGEAIKSAGYPYKFIAVDTITALEEMCIPYAELLYSKSLPGKNWFAVDGGKQKYGSILNLPDGAGYKWLRDAFEAVLNYVQTLAPKIIFFAHVKDNILDKSGAEFTSLDIDLTGKLKRIVASKCDGIGYLYRKGKNKNYLSFKTSDEVACGIRSPYLKNKEVLISEVVEKDGGEELVTHWDQIYNM